MMGHRWIVVMFGAWAAGGCAMHPGEERAGDEPAGEARQALFLNLATVHAEYDAIASDSQGRVIAEGCDQSGSWNKIFGYRPDAAGTYPVFLFVNGTHGDYKMTAALHTLQYLARRGFVAVSVQYANSRFATPCGASGNATPDDHWDKSKCIFDSADPTRTSAIEAVCALPQADCAGQGVIVSGLSQGAFVALIARQHNESGIIRGAWIMSAGTHGPGDSWASSGRWTACAKSGNHGFAQPDLRLDAGESDMLIGGLLPATHMRKNGEDMTGLDCGFGSGCSPPGNAYAGWKRWSDGAMEDGTADHAFMLDGVYGTDWGYRTNVLPAALAFMNTRVGHTVAVTSGPDPSPVCGNGVCEWDEACDACADCGACQADPCAADPDECAP